MKKYVLFGAGVYAQRAIILLGKEKISFIVDNDKAKQGKQLEGINIYSYVEKKEEISAYELLIAVSEKYYREIERQILSDGICHYCSFSDIKSRITKQKIYSRIDYIGIYQKALMWIKNNSLPQGGIICNTSLKLAYPEVTGYYIPTLIRWGYRDLAINYAAWLISIQKDNGSWFDSKDEAAYIFDSAQILKGLIAVRKVIGDTVNIDRAILLGCRWIISCMNEYGRLVTPSTECWGEDESTCSEVIHLYCLSPLKEVGVMFNEPEFVAAAEKIFSYYKTHYYEKIMSFSLLSHFYAYLMEALLDLDQEDMCREAMDKIALKQKANGAVPAYNNVDWVCSTGLFQLALVWFRLGEIEKGNKAFSYACKLQNNSGGWFGSYLSEDNSNEDNKYFPASEISWANKYFLDALYYKNKAEFNKWAPGFIFSISKDDGRYVVVKGNIPEKQAKVLDVGCGKGRYLRNLVEDLPDNKYYGVDISSEVLKNLKDILVEFTTGSLTDIPYTDDFFDVTYACEALEHAVDIESAIREMTRVTKSGGKIIIIDKNDGCYGVLDIAEWEQWPNEEALKELMLKYCSEVEVKHGLEYENSVNKDLFSAWIGIVK